MSLRERQKVQTMLRDGGLGATDRKMSMDLLADLLRTEALKLAPAGEMFWYTSGTIGPYYFNTHFLCGGQSEAEELLEFIDFASGTDDFPRLLAERVAEQLRTDPVYGQVIDALLAHIEAEIQSDFQLVSGGERRDWFFSTAVAQQLDLPHLLLFKDSSARQERQGEVSEVSDLNGKRTLHVADLVTEASSYFEKWIPAISSRGGQLAYSVNVVDRGQGGIEALKAANVEASALLRIDDGLFEELRRSGLIDEKQTETLRTYHRDPCSAMSSFLQRHADFLRSSLESDNSSTAERARHLVESNPYDLDLERLLA